VIRRLAVFAAALMTATALAGCAVGPGEASAPDAEPRPAATPTAVAPTAVSTTEVRLEHDGLDRSFRVTAPVAPGETPLPVLVALHGAGGSAVTLSYLTGFDRAAAGGAFVLVEPNGTGPDAGSRTWNAGSCCGTSAGTVDDIGFLGAMLDRVAGDLPIDPKRVYVAGFSNGGMLAYRAACELGERIAGIAVVAGTMNVDDCPAPAPVPVLAIHGADNTVVPLAGGATTYDDPRVEPWYNVPVEEAVRFWAQRDGCVASPAERTEGVARVLRWAGCAVELWIIDGGRHTWFGGPMSAEGGLEPEGSPSATDLALRFFGLAIPAG
jgi:polyhydroxybutyrate depolymerase